MPDAELQHGRDALARGAWEEARAVFDAAVRGEPVAEALITQFTHAPMTIPASWRDDQSAVASARVDDGAT